MKSRLRSGIVIIISVIVLTGYLSDAGSAEWVYFATTEKGMHYYDNKSIKRSKTTVRVLEKTIYSEEGKRKARLFLTETGEYKGQTLDYVLTLDEIHCKESKGRSLSMVIYDHEGKRVAGSRGGSTGWRDIVPESLYERLSRQVCK